MTQRIVPNYEILSPIGKGGMGVVYKATDLRLGRTVALKFLSSDSTEDRDRQRFTREAITASSLDHPNICTIYEIGNADSGELFIAMSCYDGATFRDLIQKGELPFEKSIEMMRQVGEGLQKAHRNDVIHRDVKPGNLMLTNDGIVKILDFGLARVGNNSELTNSGQLIGTIKYMSPEQIRGDNVDHRTDIWSMGVVLYELVSNRKPYKGNPAQIVNQVLNEKPRSVRKIRRDTPACLAKVIERAMTRDRRNRYQNVADMIDDLYRCSDLIRGSGHDFSGTDTLMNDTVSVDRQGLIPSEARSSGQTPSGQTLSDRDSQGLTKNVITSLAVLPFENLTRDEANDYLVDGLTDDLIHAVSLNKQLRVISRNSVYQLKNRNLSVQEIRNLLQVDTVIEGTVRISKNRVRVVARLVNTEDGHQVWSEKYDREIDDVFDLQDEIVGMIHSRLEIELESRSENVVRATYDGDIEVYELYLKGRHFFHQKAFGNSLECYEKAISLDPNFAPAHAGMAMHYALMGVYGGANPKEVWPNVRRKAMQALELAPTSSEAHEALGFLRIFADWDWDAAEQAFLEAIRLSPAHTDPVMSLTMTYMQTRQFEKAKKQLNIARRKDPLSPLISAFNIGFHVYTREFEKAIEYSSLPLESAETFDLLFSRAMAYHGIGRLDDAIVEFKRLYQMSGEGSFIAGFLGVCHGLAGQTEKAEHLLELLQKRAEESYVQPSSIAMILGGIGRLDDALDQLEIAANSRDSLLCYAGVLPTMDPLRAHPHFDVILNRIGLA